MLRILDQVYCVFDEEQCKTLNLTNNIANFLSLIGVICFVIMFCFTPTPRLTYLKCIGHLFFGNLLYFGANIFSNLDLQEEKDLCKIDGSLRLASLWLEYFWATSIGFIAYKHAVYHKDPNQYYCKFIIVSYGIGITLACIPLIEGTNLTYAPHVNYCWISDKNGQLLSQLTRGLSFGLPVLASIIMSLYWYIRTALFVRGMIMPVSGVSPKKLFAYPLIMIITMLPVVIQQCFLETLDHYGMALAHLLMLHSIGIFNVIAYGFEFFADQEPPAQESTIKNRSSGQEMMIRPQITSIEQIGQGIRPKSESEHSAASNIQENKNSVPEMSCINGDGNSFVEDSLKNDLGTLLFGGKGGQGNSVVNGSQKDILF